MPAPSHRMTRQPFYNSWNNMKIRCLNKNSKDYPNWGGRGITISDEWLLFENFKNDMLPTYSKGLSLDRIDNSKGYSKGNCRWADKITQGNNTRQNRPILFNGILQTIPQWARATGIKRSTLAQRIHVYKWSIEKSLLTPTR